MVPGRAFRVKRIAQNGMTHCKAMNSQLVRTTCFREKAQSALALPSFELAPLGNRWATILKVDHLLGSIWPVHDQRQVNHPGFVGDFSLDTGNVSLLDLPFLELQSEMALRMRREGEYHDTRRVSIKPVDQQGMGKSGLHPSKQTI